MSKSKRKKSTKKRSAEKKMPLPTMPQDVLSDFLEEKIKVRDIPNVYRIKDNFLWEKNGVQRFRINVWVEEYQEGRYCPKIYIKHSFFVRFNKETEQVVDKTIEQTITLETVKRGIF